MLGLKEVSKIVLNFKYSYKKLESIYFTLCLPYLNWNLSEF